MKKLIIYLLILIAVVLAAYGAFNYYQYKIRNSSLSIIDLKNQSLAEDYVRMHINVLSAAAEGPSGQLAVTKIIFNGAKQGTAEYGDGKNNYRADFSYTVATGSVVTIDSFKISTLAPAFTQDTNPTALVGGTPFSQVGNLVAEEGADGWLLIYDLPGVPAARATLKITNTTKCLAVDGPISCNSWTAGDRVKVDGKQADRVVEAETITEVGTN